MPKITDAQLVEALAENGHEEEADALAAKLEAADAGDEPPPAEADMNALIRRRAGR